jgi:hypothetical protein
MAWRHAGGLAEKIPSSIEKLEMQLLVVYVIYAPSARAARSCSTSALLSMNIWA